MNKGNKNKARMTNNNRRSNKVTKTKTSSKRIRWSNSNNKSKWCKMVTNKRGKRYSWRHVH